MRGLPIVRALQAADVAQPPALVFAQRSCLTFAVQPRAPLLHLRPAAPSAALAVDCVASDLAALLFPEWEAAGVALEVPRVLLAGQVAPLALVVSNAQGRPVGGVTLATSSPDLVVLPGASVGALSAFLCATRSAHRARGPSPALCVQRRCRARAAKSSSRCAAAFPCPHRRRAARLRPSLPATPSTRRPRAGRPAPMASNTWP